MSRRLRALVGAALVAVALATSVSDADGQDGGLVADDLATADGLGWASPIGTVLRVPNEIGGGALLSKTTFTLDKTQAIAAGYTPGELGEAFLETTLVAPEGTPPEIGENIAWKNPSLITAQTPPSNVFPAQTSLADGGVNVPPVEAASLRSSTTEKKAEANAIGGIAISQSDLTIGNGGSRSSSELLDDGTVVSKAHAFIEDIRLAGGLLKIGGINSMAEVAFRPGHEPTQKLDIEIAGATVAGTPVVIDQDGVRVADTPLIGLGEIAQVNDILSSLADQGLSVTLFPGVVREADDRSVRVAGAGLSIRGVLTDYVPTSVDTPLGPVGSPVGDVGTDNEILLGLVEASAFAAERGPLPDFGSSGPEVSAPPPPATVAPVESTPVITPAPPASTTPSTADGNDDQGSSEVAAPPAGGGDFELIRQQEPPGVAALRTGYRWVMLCALAGAIAYLVRQRTRFA